MSTSDKDSRDCVLKAPYLDIVALVVVAALPEQAMSHHAMNVELVQHRVGVLSQSKVGRTSTLAESSAQRRKGQKTDFGKRGGEDDDFVDLAHPPQELIDAGSFDDEHVVRLVLYLYRHDVVCC